MLENGNNYSAQKYIRKSTNNYKEFKENLMNEIEIKKQEQLKSNNFKK